MVGLWVRIIGVCIGLIVGSAWSDFAAGIAYDLTKLGRVCVDVEELPDEAERYLGLKRESIGNYAYVWLKGKLPRLQLERGFSEDCSPGVAVLYIDINLGVGKTVGGRTTDYYGSVRLSLTRRALWESGKVGLGIAYNKSIRVTGPIQTAEDAVRKSLDEMLTDFAAEYYKAGNP